MRKDLKKYEIFGLILLLTVLSIPSVAFANSAQPPSIIVLVSNPPKDLEIHLDRDGQIIEGKKTEKMLESSFSFYSYHFKKNETYQFCVIAEGEKIFIPIDTPLTGYNNLYTLDLKKNTVTQGRAPYKNALFIALRVLLTLLIEGLIFYAFGFRKKESWMIFFLLNLITQGALNIWLNSMFPTNGYIIFALVIGEFFVFLAELIGFTALVREQKRLKTAAYVIFANLVSLVLGGYLITLLPL
ncbi:hypothetical protein SANA_00280 [Gottschalkiaceae bacterium SANA]|nr:hypothetical protein SANA_00280 [Gottschalkiaceae bacterium SANA]